MSTHATKLASEGIRYLGDLQLSDLVQLHEELDALWNSGQSQVSNDLYDKVVDGINYETSQLTSDPFDFVVKRTNYELKNIIDYFTRLRAPGKSCIEKSVLDIIRQECALRHDLFAHPNATYPSHWTVALENESSVQLVTLARSSQEFQDLSEYFAKSLGRLSTVIYSIIRIQNFRLWIIHQQLQRTIQCESTRLIHGTASPLQQKRIIHHGFHRSYCPGGLIGDGIYFALRATYSNDDPYVMRKSPHRRELFICRVLLGNTILGKHGLTSPPPNHHAVHYSNSDEIDEFCIFKHYQAYPEYIIQYDYQKKQ